MKSLLSAAIIAAYHAYETPENRARSVAVYTGSAHDEFNGKGSNAA
jgi:hypothetical protein